MGVSAGTSNVLMNAFAAIITNTARKANFTGFGEWSVSKFVIEVAKQRQSTAKAFMGEGASKQQRGRGKSLYLELEQFTNREELRGSI